MGASKKVAIAIVAITAVITLTLSGCTLLFSGGVGNIIRNHKPAPDVEGGSITRKRLKATEAVESALAAVDAGAGFTSYATSTDDRCYKGENNWKLTDGYAHRCTVRITRFYGMSGDFRTHMRGLEDLLASGGWQLPHSAFRDMFATYYDVYCSSRRIAIFGSGPVDRPSCEVSNLPRNRSSGYRKGNLELWIECAERGESNLHMMDLMQRGPIGALHREHDRAFNLYEKTNLQDVAAQVREITASHRYVVSVTVQETYFEN